MLIAVVALMFGGPWAIDDPREQCAFFADETSSVEDQSFADASAYFPQGAFPAWRCTGLSFELARHGFEPLRSVRNQWEMRVLLRRSWHQPVSFRITDDEVRGSFLLHWRESPLLENPRTGIVQLSRRQTEALQYWAPFICSASREPGMGADGESWLFEYAESDNYCVHSTWSPSGGPFKRLGSLLMEYSNYKFPSPTD
jgi:hypothetical protein